MRTDKEPYFDPKKRLPNFKEISQFCSSLVEVVPAFDEINVLPGEDGLFGQPTSKHRTIRLAHSSVKMFLTPAHLDPRWAPYFESTTVDASVAKTCLCYTIQYDDSGFDVEIDRRYQNREKRSKRSYMELGYLVIHIYLYIYIYILKPFF